MFKASLCVLLSSTILFLTSCTGPKKTIYFTEDTRPDSNVFTQTIAEHGEAVIQPNDILAINIASPSFAPEDKPSMVFLNGGLTYNTSPTGGGVSSGNNSFLVDSSGYIDYPRIGRLKMGGLSITRAKEELAMRLKDYLKQPVLEVRILNYRITMLGEVGTPGPLLTSNHKMTILDAIASSGGIPITGRKDNVMIIREVNGQREFARLDLNSRNVFHSPYFYLRQNDIVYVEPSHIRTQEGNEFLKLYLPSITSILSLVLMLYSVAILVDATK